jgi:adenylate cyclase
MIRIENRHDLPFPREAIWAVLRRTDWLNRSLGVPPVVYDIQPRAEGGSVVHASARVLGRELRWREFPFEWLEPEYYRVRRIFESGPLNEGRMGMILQERPGGTQVLVYSEFDPRHAPGKWLTQRLLAPRIRSNMARVIAHVEEHLHGRARVSLPRLPVQPVNETELQAGLKKLRDLGQPAELVNRLEAFLREEPDVELTHIRPLAVARKWECDPWKVLSLFLHAPHCGLLNLRWEVLCPGCRSSRKSPAGTLDQLKSTSHCEICHIDYGAEFDKSVELKFAVSPAIRPIQEQTFCLAGPGGTPHIVSQLWLEPGEKRQCKLPSGPASLRMRSPQVRTALTLPFEEGSHTAESLSVSCAPDGFVVTRAPAEQTGGSAQIINPNSFPILVSVEQIDWSTDILTAARVTNWQEFRDLFAREVISPSEEVTVGSQVVLFTDLRGSTALYHSVGDARAYAVVRNHFAVLTTAVRDHHGGVVKTIGDAVMATFSRVDEALGAVREMHRKLVGTEQPDGKPLVLKSSLHLGPCLAVNANDRLDYFGTTINRASRMLECCRGGDLSVSDELYQRPEMSALLAEIGTPAESVEVRFRGFDSPHRVWRLAMS